MRILISLALVFLTTHLYAENLFVRPDGGDYGLENGSDWNHAFDGFAGVAWGTGTSAVSAGDTLYVSGGNYRSNLTIGMDGRSTSPIAIKRATLEDHGTDTGWRDNFDSLIEIDQAHIDIRSRSYVTLDGVRPYGIRMTGLSNSSGINKYIWIGADVNSEPSTHIVIRNFEIIGPGELLCDGTQAIGVFGHHRRVNHLTISHVKAHEFSGAAFRMGEHDNLLIEHCEIYNVRNPSAEACGGHNPHNTHIALYGTIQSDHITIRGNYLYQEYDDDMVDGGYTIGFGYVSGDADIYNNVFFNVTYSVLCAENPMPTVPGSRINFYNNTVIGFRTMSWRDGSRFYAANNIFCNNGFDPESTRWPFSESLALENAGNLFCRDAYSDRYENGQNIILSEGEDPFADLGNPDLHEKIKLSSESPALDRGMSLEEYFTTDLQGKPRPQGAGWDIGAYEYAPLDGIPNPPEGLRVTNP